MSQRGPVQRTLVNESEVVKQRSVAHGQRDEGAHGRTVRKMSPESAATSVIPQHNIPLFPLLGDETSEFVIAVHVQHARRGRHDDGREDVEQHADRRVEKKRLVFVQHVLRTQQLDFVHDGNRPDRDQVLDGVRYQLEREYEGEAFVSVPKDRRVTDRVDQKSQAVVDEFRGDRPPGLLLLQVISDLRRGVMVRGDGGRGQGGVDGPSGQEL